MPPRLRTSAILSQCRVQHARAFSFSATAKTQVSSSDEKKLSREHQAPDSAYLRIVVGLDNRRLQSPAEIFAVVRAVERKYGALKEYRFLKDAELSSFYQTVAQLTFVHPASLKRIPEGSETFTVSLPRIDTRQPGGIGLSELKDLLLSEKYVEENTSIPTFDSVMKNASDDAGGQKEQISARIERARSQWNGHLPYGSWHPATSSSFVAWGGFHPLNPVSAETPLPTELTAHTSTVDHFAMRRALRLHSKYLKKPNPYETYANNSTAESSISASQWEPLPGEDPAPTDTPMPSDIQASLEQRQPPTESQLTSSVDSNDQLMQLHPAADEPVVDNASAQRLPSTPVTEPSVTVQSAVGDNIPESYEMAHVLEAAPDTQVKARQSEIETSEQDQPAQPSQVQRDAPSKDTELGDRTQEPNKIKQKLSSFFNMF